MLVVLLRADGRFYCVPIVVFCCHCCHLKLVVKIEVPELGNATSNDWRGRPYCSRLRMQMVVLAAESARKGA